jgi:flagellar biosynthesis protein FlgN
MIGLIALVRAETSCVDAVSAILEQQVQAMAERRLSDLPPITEALDRCTTELADIDRRREAAQVDCGFAAGRAGAAAAAQADPDCGDAWHALLAATARSRTLRLRAAATVFTHLEFTSDALDFLRSRSHSLYGPDGVRRRATGGATLSVG